MKSIYLFLILYSMGILSSAQEYCSPTTDGTDYEWITNVTFAGINNTTAGIAGLNDYTGQSATVSIGSVEEMSVTIHADSREYVYVFIDWNQNGVLNDEGEVYIVAELTSSNGPFITYISVPEDAVPGPTRMRVMLKYNSPPDDPCTSYFDGEIEDYTVNVGMGTTYVPDNNFEQALIDFGYDDTLDDYVLTSNINGIAELNLFGKNIGDLTGIEDFTALLVLHADNNHLTSLDVSHNNALIQLSVVDNNLTALDVSHNTALESLSVGLNNLTSLDVSSNTALTLLYAYGNHLTSLDVGTNTALTYLSVFDNQLTSLDVSHHPELMLLWCHDNQLTNLNVKNGHNTAIENQYFNATGNPSLGCIQVDDAEWSAGNWTQVNETVSFREDCTPPGVTYVPDNNFEQALIDLGYDDVLDDYVLTANISDIIELDISNKNIVSLVGIEDFTALAYLNCQNNEITNLDISHNIALISLNTSGNQLTSIGVSYNSNLTYLSVSDNQLTELDVSYNTSLIILTTDQNQLTSLDVRFNTALNALLVFNNHLTSLELGANTALTTLGASGNELTSLDVSHNPALTLLHCQDNQLAYLNVKNGNNAAISSFKATGNPDLNCIQVDDVEWSATHWTEIDEAASFSETCAPPGYTYIPDSNFEQVLILFGYDDFPNHYVWTANIKDLTSLNVANWDIADLTGIEDFISLTSLNCSSNSITNLDLSHNTALTTLHCEYNQLTDLNLSSQTALTTLYCNNNQLTSLDLTHNTALERVYCHTNQLMELDISQNTACVLTIKPLLHLSYL